MNGGNEQGEQFVRKTVGGIEPPVILRLKYFSIQRSPFLVFGFSPAMPFSLVFHFGLRSVAIGPHIVILPNPKFRGYQ